MQWGKHFQIASGSHKDKTHSGARYETFSFRNGDDLIHFPKSERWFIIYADQQKPERCQVEDSFTYPVVSLPRYSGKEDALSLAIKKGKHDGFPCRYALIQTAVWKITPSAFSVYWESWSKFR